MDNKSFAHHRSSLYWVDPAKLTILSGLNCRDMDAPENVDHVRFLADQIRENGFIPAFPLEVAQIDGANVVTSGHCRYAAVMLLRTEGFSVEQVPYVPEPQGVTNVERYARQTGAANSGKTPSALEQGHNAKRLMGLGLSSAEVAKRTGRSETYVDRLLGLQAAPEDVKLMVKTGEVSAKLAADTLKREGETAGASVLRESVAAARAVGKKKATPKDVQKRVEAKDSERKFRIRHMPKTGLLAVRIGNAEFKFTAEVWLDMATKIASEASKIFVHERGLPPPQFATYSEVDAALAERESARDADEIAAALAEQDAEDEKAAKRLGDVAFLEGKSAVI